MNIRKAAIKGLKGAAALLNEKRIVAIPTPVHTDRLLEGKVALITGGSGGIGLAMAKAFLRSGCKVIIAGTKEEKLNTCCASIGGGQNSRYST